MGRKIKTAYSLYGCLGEDVYLKSSDIVSGWVKEGNVWKVEIDNKLFNGFNPFELNVFGD